MEYNFGSIFLSSGYNYKSYYYNEENFTLKDLNSSSIVVSFMSKEDNIKFIKKYGPFTIYDWIIYILEWEIKDTLKYLKSEGIFTLSAYYQLENGNFNDDDYNNDRIIKIEYITTPFVCSRKIVNQFVYIIIYIYYIINRLK